MSAAVTRRPDGKTGPIAAAVERSNLADVYAEEAGVPPSWPAGNLWIYATRECFSHRVMSRHVGSMIADRDVSGRCA